MRKPSNRQTSSTRVRDRLRSDIFSGHLAPGARVTVGGLAKRYGTSPMPIREALQELQGQGLVTGIPRRGARIRAVDAEFVANVYDLRTAIIGLLLARCVRYITNVDIEEIEAIQAECERVTRNGDVAGILQAHHRFHDRLYRIAHNAEAHSAVERTWPLLHALRSRFGFGPGRHDESNRNHRRLIEALRQRDEALAVQLGQDSSERAKQDLLAMMRGGAISAGAGSARRGAGRPRD